MSVRFVKMSKDDLENKIINLEEKRQEREQKRLEEEKWNTPDWKQWIPIYGVFQLIKDERRNKPSIMDDSIFIYVFTATYQAASVSLAGCGLLYGAYQLMQYLDS